MNYSRRLCLLAAFGIATSVASAQCTTPTRSFGAIPGVVGGGPLVAHYWPPNTTRPNPHLVLGGQFMQAGHLPTHHIAAMDLVTGEWLAFGSGANQAVNAIASLPNGDLVIGGNFTQVDGTKAHHIARWNGASWATIGGGLSGRVDTMITLPNGDLVVGGALLFAGGTPASRIARWDGAAWNALGSGCDHLVLGLTALANGDLVAVGEFTTAGGVAANRVARWDGSAWHAMGSGMNQAVIDVSTLPTGDVVASGVFTTAGGVAAQGLARWDGSAWHSMGLSVTAPRHITLPNGDVVALNHDISGNTTAWRWDGNGWTTLTSPTPNVWDLAALTTGQFAVLGAFESFEGWIASGVAIWNGSSFAPLPGGLRPTVFAIAPPAAGSSSGPVAATGGLAASPMPVAEWVDSRWRDLGVVDADAYAVARLADDSVLVGGIFNHIGGTPAARIARRVGGIWQPLGSGVNSSIYALAELPNGDVVAGGNFSSAGGVPADRIARWDGSAWHAMGSGMNADVYALSFVPDSQSPQGGVLYAGGAFSTAGGNPASHVAAWDGTSWLGLASGMNAAVHALCSTSAGDLIAGGAFTTAGGGPAARVARRNGGSWQACGSGTSGPVYALTPLQNGDFIAGGLFATAGSATVNNLARWNGTIWSGFGSGTDAAVMALATMPDGDVWAGGYFTTVDNQSSLHTARITTTCPAIAMPFLSGCPSSGGNNTLAATTLPWADATFVATGTGLPTTALALTLTSVTSFPQGAVPLLLAFAEAGPGCDVLVAPDILGALVTTTGTATSSFFLPDSPPIVGVTFYHQLVPFDLGSGAITATNALQLTAGRF